VLCKHEVVGSIPSGSTSGASSTKIDSRPANSLRAAAMRLPVIRHREEEVHPIV
jgi:hypothetical protein